MASLQSPIRNIFSRLGLKTRVPVIEHVTLAEKPSFTGNGPFVELPQFNPIGYPSTLLNITIPASSALNLRRGSVIAINGNVSQLSSSDKLLFGTRYQELRSDSAVSILINGNSENYSIIDITNKDEKWVVLQDESLISWTGYNFHLSPLNVISKYRTFVSQGKGKMVVDGESQLFDIELKDNEELFLNPNAFVATSIPSESISLQVLRRPSLLGRLNTKSVPKFSIPSVPIDGLLGSAFNYAKDLRSKGISLYRNAVSSISSEEVTKVWHLVKQYFGQFSQFVQIYVLTFILKRSPITFKLKGPGRVLFNNKGQVSNGRTFTRKEIYDIFNR